VNGNGSAEAANTPSFAAAVGLVRYGARPRDHIPARGEEPRLFGKLRQRLRGWLHSSF